jgi:hypothetical protein
VWALASQTLGQHETVLFGMSLALFMLTKEPKDQPPSGQSRGGIKAADLWVASAGLGLAGWARPQVASTFLSTHTTVIFNDLSFEEGD